MSDGSREKSKGSNVLFILLAGFGVICVICCGISGIVGYRVTQMVREAISTDPVKITAMTRDILDITIPPDYEPKSGINFGFVKTVIYVNRVKPEALIMLTSQDTPAEPGAPVPITVPGSDPDEATPAEGAATEDRPMTAATTEPPATPPTGGAPADGDEETTAQTEAAENEPAMEGEAAKPATGARPLPAAKEYVVRGEKLKVEFHDLNLNGKLHRQAVMIINRGKGHTSVIMQSKVEDFDEAVADDLFRSIK